MLRMTLSSLVLGAMLLLLGTYAVYLPAREVPPLLLQGQGENAMAEAKDKTLLVGPSGRGQLIRPFSAVKAADYPFIHLEFATAPPAGSLYIMWSESLSDARARVYGVSGESGKSVWLDTRKLSGWEGSIGVLGVMLEGQPGSRYGVERVDLLPASLGNQLQAIFNLWGAALPWDQQSNNIYPGVRAGSTALAPAPVLGALLLFSLLSYTALWFLLRSRAHLDWRVIACLVLVCWLVLDFLSQLQMIRNIQDSRALYAGKTTQEQLAVGPDAKLVEFASAVSQRLDAPDARVFVTSDNDYRGMRGAYYLYPHNVFWKRKSPRLPVKDSFEAGDYIVVLNPSSVRFSPALEELKTANGMSLKVKPLFSQSQGSLFEVL